MSDKVGGILATIKDLITRTKGLDEIYDEQLTNKEKVFMGVPDYPAFSDYFSLVADGAAPDITYWTVVEDNDASVTVVSQINTNLMVIAGTGATDDGYTSTLGKITWSLDDLGKKLYANFTLAIGDLTGEGGIGFRQYGTVPTADLFDNVNRHAVLHFDNDVISASTADGMAEQNTDLSAFIVQGTYYNFRIVVDPGVDVKYYINDTLRATHNTNPPSRNVFFAVASKNTNGITTTLYFSELEIWPAA